MRRADRSWLLVGIVCFGGNLALAVYWIYSASTGDHPLLYSLIGVADLVLAWLALRGVRGLWNLRDL